jgi:hypothetical protein
MPITNSKLMNNSNLPSYNQVVQITAQTNAISDIISPSIIANNPDLHPTTDIRGDIKTALIHLHKLHIGIVDTLTPTQRLILAAYHQLAISLYDIIKHFK